MLNLRRMTGVLTACLVLTLGASTWAQGGAPAKAAPAKKSAAPAKPTKPAAAPVDQEEEVEAQGDAEEKSPKVVGWVELSGELDDAPPPFAWIDEDDGKPTLRRVLRQLKTIANDDRYAGVVLYLDDPDLSMTQIDELEAGIKAVRAAGKKVLAFSEHYSLSSYALACTTDQVLLQRKGLLEIQGLGVEEIYAAGLLEKIGVKADFIQVGKFKGAQEPLTRNAPSPEWDQNFNALLDDLYDQVLTRIGKARRLTKPQVEQAFADAWLMSDAEYVKRKLVDRLVDRDLTEATGPVFGDQFVWDNRIGKAARGQAMAMDNPFAIIRMLMQTPAPQVRRASIAMVRVVGPITSGEGGGGLFGSESVGSRTLVRALGQARDNPLVRGVVIRVDSPGGSAIASEVIWQAVRELAAQKPVFVSIGSMAASGGYYVACAGGEIYVTPESIVGSIGVVGGKITLGGLYEKIGLHITRRSRGPMGDMFNSVEPFTVAQRTAIESAFKRTYDQFTDRVSTGRGQRLKDVGAVAEGRLFTGRQAVANGMADKLGGVDVALAAMADKCGLREGAYDVVDLPGPISFPEFLDRIFSVAPGGGASAPDAAMLNLARQLLGERTWSATADTLTGIMMLQREPVLTLMPRTIVIK